MEELVEDPSVVFISHGDCLEEAEGLAEAIREKFPVQRLEINYVGPVIGNHSGPGTLALFFQGKHK
jgi:fatty acid-binding protein DegV